MRSLIPLAAADAIFADVVGYGRKVASFEQNDPRDQETSSDDEDEGHVIVTVASR